MSDIAEDQRPSAVRSSLEGTVNKVSAEDRVLKRIDNTENTQSIKRKHIETQEMENLNNRDKSRQDKNFKSHIPLPKSRLSRELNIMTEKNKRGTNIPKPGERNTGSELDMQHINKLMGIRETLGKRPVGPVNKGDDSLRTRLAKVESLFTEDMDKQVDLEFELDHQLKDLKKQADDLDAELVETKRSHKKLVHRLSDLQMDITSAKRSFELTEESAMKNVSHKEQLINIQIKELSNNLDNQYNEIKFELQNELHTAKSYKDETEMEDIKRLMKEIEILENQVDETKLRKQKTLKGEMDILDDELNGSLKSKVEELDNLDKNVEASQLELKELQSTLDRMKESKEKKFKENDDLKKKLSTIEIAVGSFEATRSSLLRQMNVLKSEFNESKNQEDEIDSVLHDIKSDVENIELKKKKHDQQRRILEDSIMNYESKIRIYIKPDSQKVGENIQNTQSQNGTFNKVFPHFSSNEDIINEYLSLVGHVISGSNVALVFTGKKESELLNMSLSRCFDHLKQRSVKKPNWNFNYFLRCIKFDDSYYDLLDNRNHIRFNSSVQELGDINAQKMTIDDASSLAKVVDEFAAMSMDVAYIITVEAVSSDAFKKIESNFIHLSITPDDPAVQKSVLQSGFSKSTTPASTFLRFAFNHSKPLVFGSIDESFSNSEFVNILSKLGATECPYRRD